jgi:hypothetical protein
MVSMKMETEEGVRCSPPAYGYGLCLYLNDDQCEALGIKKALEAGSTVNITAKAVVTRSTQSVEADGDDTGPDYSLELQITDMELRQSGGSTASRLYPKSS